MRRRSFLFLLPMAWLTMSSVMATELDYSVKELSLEKVAEDLSLALGTPVTVSDGHGMIIRNWSFKGKRHRAIADLASRSMLHFNFDGSTYELASRRTLNPQVMRLPLNDRAQATAIIRQAFPAYSADSITWVKASDSYSVIVRGTKRFHDTLASVLKPCADNCRSIHVLRYGQSEK